MLKQKLLCGKAESYFNHISHLKLRKSEFWPHDVLVLWKLLFVTRDVFWYFLCSLSGVASLDSFFPRFTQAWGNISLSSASLPFCPEWQTLIWDQWEVLSIHSESCKELSRIPWHRQAPFLKDRDADGLSSLFCCEKNSILASRPRWWTVLLTWIYVAFGCQFSLHPHLRLCQLEWYNQVFSWLHLITFLTTLFWGDLN